MNGNLTAKLSKATLKYIEPLKAIQRSYVNGLNSKNILCFLPLKKATKKN